MTDAEWAALSLDVRMWCIDQARQSIVPAPGPVPLPADKLVEVARVIATVLLGPPQPAEIQSFAAGQDAPVPPASWRQERGLA